MKRYSIHHMFTLSAIAIAAIVGIALESCRFAPKEVPEVVVSIPPQKYLMDQIVGDKVNVISLLSTESNPETFEPRMSDMMAIERSKGFFTIGNIGYEFAIFSKVKNNNPDLLIVKTFEGVKFLNSQDVDESGQDPHIWTSPRNAKIMAQNMYNGLVQLFPKYKKYFTKRYNKLIHHLDELDAQLTAQLAPVKGCTFLVWHPSLSYFANDYGLKQVSLDNGKEPTAADLKARLDTAMQSGAKVLFMQKQIDSRQATALLNEISVKKVAFNPMSGNWEEEVHKVADAIAPRQIKSADERR